MNAKQTGYFKIGLIVVLAIVFLGVVANSVMTISRPSPSPRAAIAGARGPQAAARAPQPVAPVTAAEPRVEALPQVVQPEATKRSWPTFAVDEIIACDPFLSSKPVDVASSKSQPSAGGDGKEGGQNSGAESAAGSGESKSAFTERIHAVYQRGGRTAALVGSKTMRAGDELEGGGRIVEVDQGGVVLEVKK